MHFRKLLPFLAVLACVPAFAQGIKISELPSATTPLVGTEITTVVQGGVTKRATVTQVIAGAQPLDADLTSIASLTDPNADRILFWDDSAGGYRQLAIGSGLDLTGTTLTATGGGGGAPSTATYITQTPDATLSGEQALSALTTGLLKSTTGTGLLSIAVPGTDYLALSAIGSTVEAYDPDLSTLAALAKTDDSIAVANGSTWQLKTLTDCHSSTNAVTYDASTNGFGCNTIAGGGGGGSGTVNAGVAGGLAFYATSGTALDDVAPGADGTILQMVSGVPTFVAGLDVPGLSAPSAVNAADCVLGYSTTDSLSRKYCAANLRELVLGNALADPNADRLLFWDDSASKWDHLTLGTNLSITGTTLNASGGGGGGDFSSNTSSSVDGEIVLFSGTAGKTGKRATGSGMAKLTSGVLSAGTAGTDYVVPAGNVATATALAANGANCSAGQAPLGVNASGAVEGCTTYLQSSDGLDITALTAIDAVAAGDLFLVLDASASNAAKSATAAQIATYTGGGGAPTGAKYIVQTADGTLSAEQALSALATGIVKNTTTTGVLSIAASTDVIGMFSGTCTSSSSRYLATDGSCQVLAGGGDASTNTSSSVDSEVVLFSSTGGKTLKRATQTGIAKLTAGVLSAATSGTDYVVPAGNVATATALAANGGNCATGQAAGGVSAAGVSEACVAINVVASPSAGTTLTPDCTNTQVNGSNTSATGTWTIANPGTCTAVDGQRLTLRLLSTNSQTYSFGSAYAAGAVALPTTHTGASKYDYALFIFNSTPAKWQFVATAAGF